MRLRSWHAVLAIVLAAAVVLLLSSTVDAQCSMCRAALTSSTDGKFIKNFNLAVLVLLVPPVSMFCSIFILLRKHRGDG
jgi:hypothetical protein